MAAAPFDLTTLSAVKSWLGIPDATTTSDVLIQSLITAASRYLINWLSRGNILSATYTDRFDGTGYGQRSLMLPRWPVTSIVAMSVGINAIPAAVAPAPGGQNPSGYLLEPWDGIPAGRMQSIDLFGYGIPKGLQVVSVTYVAGYLGTDPAAVIPATPFQITAQQLYGAWAADGGVLINGVAAVKVANAPVTGQYTAAAGGIYTFALADVGKSAVISYSYIPLDLAMACFQLVGEQYTYRSRIGVASKTLGGQETITFSTKNLTPDIVTALQNYKAVIPFLS